MFIVPDEKVVACCNRITSQIIGAAIEVHRHLGSGVLESAYEDCLCWEMELRGISFQRQLVCPIEYKGHRTERGYRIDLLIENLIIVELKAEPRIEKIHETQLHTYLRLNNLYLGIILNFHEERLKDGVRRVINLDAATNVSQIAHLS